MERAEPPPGLGGSHSRAPAGAETDGLGTARRPKTRALVTGLVVAAFGAGLVFLLLGEHRVHVLGWAPYLLLLLCPLLHLGMHGAHGAHHGDPEAREETAQPGGRTRQNPS
ncbi:MAG: DUF2933 domain-containing protein [Phenylobacterium sp.]|nr:DUF2933 domain-containing protein [Phenylobacterium sp.]TAJ71759.1 MAG: DUF2933 domain-containing protein [Phenylobacterium sp.]